LILGAISFVATICVISRAHQDLRVKFEQCRNAQLSCANDLRMQSSRHLESVKSKARRKFLGIFAARHSNRLPANSLLSLRSTLEDCSVRIAASLPNDDVEHPLVSLPLESGPTQSFRPATKFTATTRAGDGCTASPRSLTPRVQTCPFENINYPSRRALDQSTSFFVRRGYLDPPYVHAGLTDLSANPTYLQWLSVCLAI
jgi:hypothetical protein